MRSCNRARFCLSFCHERGMAYDISLLTCWIGQAHIYTNYISDMLFLRQPKGQTLKSPLMFLGVPQLRFRKSFVPSVITCLVNQSDQS